MKNWTRDFLRRTVYRLLYGAIQQRAMRQWERKGRPAPPPHQVKVNTVREYAQRYHVTTLVETGTYYGDMLAATQDIFSRIYSIEIDNLLYKKAVKRFHKHPHITILHGDSGTRLPQVLASLREPCIFWLDGHYSAGVTSRGDVDSPIEKELQLIFGTDVVRHVVLIDDAREFSGQNGYPTLEQLEAFVQMAQPGIRMEVENDIIRLHRLI